MSQNAGMGPEIAAHDIVEGLEAMLRYRGWQEAGEQSRFGEGKLRLARGIARLIKELRKG